jgi:sugar lactone lactonase YvrE
MRFSWTLLGLMVLLASGCDYNPDYTSAPPMVDPPAVAFAEGLWTVSGAPGEIVRLDATQLLTDGTLTPATRLFTSSASLFTLNSIAFDDAGVMWVASEDDSELLGFAPGTEGAAGFITPSISIRPVSGSIAGPTGMAFDIDGSLWVANLANGTIVRFEKSQLSKSGAPIPSVTITGVANPTGLAFDASATLWVTDLRANTVSRYLRGQLTTSGEKPPAIVLRASSNSLVNPAGIAFDSFNNMWIANTGAESVVEFRPPQRTSSGSPIPVVTIRPTETSLGVPAGLAFDTEGSLWIMGGQGTLSKFTAGSIAGSGNAEPLLQVKLANSVLLWSVAFWPKPSGFPLN